LRSKSNEQYFIKLKNKLMKQMINKVVVFLQSNPQLLKTMYCLVIVVLVATNLHAQTITDPGGEPDEVPIDGGLSLLVAAGVGYGAKKLKEKRKK
jgi:hypothetical protein